MTVLLKDALKPNLVQTLENNPAFIHGGPFANIAHGCNSVLATQTALKLADYVVTEAGFGADLGAEKFIDIKCRKAGLRPRRRCIVATIRALKYHGGCDLKDAQQGKPGGAREGHRQPGAPRQQRAQRTTACRAWCAINHFTFDTEAEFKLLQDQDGRARRAGGPRRATGPTAAPAPTSWRARSSESPSAQPRPFTFVYDDQLPLWDKMKAIATKIYGAADITADSKVREQIKTAAGRRATATIPVCVAKTQYSFSTDPQLRGAPSGHAVNVREVRLAAGAEFIVMICGDIMTMPGLPKVPSAVKIDIDDQGNVVGLS